MATQSKNDSIVSGVDAGYPASLMGCTDFVLTTLGYLVSDVVDAALEPLGLRLRQYRLLRMLYIDGAQRQNAIGTQLDIDRTSVVALVDDLENNGLAKRERSAEDRRAYVVVITAKGRKVAATAIERLSKTEAAMFQPLKHEEKNELKALARALLSLPGPIAEQHRRAVEALDRSAASPTKARPEKRSARKHALV